MRFNANVLETNRELLVAFIRKDFLKALELALLLENNEEFLLLILEEYRKRKSFFAKISKIFTCGKKNRQTLYEHVLNVFTEDEKVHEQSEEFRLFPNSPKICLEVEEIEDDLPKSPKICFLVEQVLEEKHPKKEKVSKTALNDTGLKYYLKK